MKTYIKQIIVLASGIVFFSTAGIQVAVAADICDDLNPCTTDITFLDPNFGIECIHVDAPFGTSCDDNIHCNGEDICNGDSLCIHRNPPDCTFLDTECQTGVCNEAQNICTPINKASTTACNDGLDCTINDHCEDGFCTGGAPRDCVAEMGTDPGSCGRWYCNEDVGRCEIAPANEDQPCDDGSFCTVNGVCINGFCSGEPRDCSAAGEGCTFGSCDEENDICIAGANKPSGTACDDGLFCTVSETCDGHGHCGSSLPKNCSNLGGVCADGVCNEDTDQCEAVPRAEGLYCDDGLFCTINTTCDGEGNCVGEPRSCSGIGSTCAPGTCIESPPSCVPIPVLEGTPCDDGMVCTLTDTCDGNGACLGSGANPCNDNIDCTNDYCDPVGNQCVNQPNPCNDGNSCTNGDICNGQSGACEGTPLPNGVSCVPVGGGSGICLDGFCHQGCTVDEDCDDGIPCTIEGCNTVSHTCEVIPEHGICNDHVFCNGSEICDPIEGCIDGTPPTCDDDVSCTQDYCDTLTDNCKHLARNELCADDSWCNGDEICNAATGCQEAVASRDCDDDIACTIDGCDDTQRRCTHEADNMLCDNGQYCDGEEWCSPLTGCRDGAPPACADTVTCTVDTCDEENDICLHEPDDTLCNDHVFCNGDERCDAQAGCMADELRNCDDGIDCTQDSCDAGSDACINVPVDNLCDDGSFCNGAEHCSPEFGCQGGDAVNCADAHECTIDACNDESDDCMHSPVDALCDDGRFCTGEEVCDADHGCYSATTPDCDDGFDCTTDYCNSQTDACSHLTDDNICRDDSTCTVDSCQDGQGCVYQPVTDTLPCTIETENDGLCWDGVCVSDIPDGDEEFEEWEDEAEQDAPEESVETEPLCTDDHDCTGDLVCDQQYGHCVAPGVADACEACLADRSCIHYADGARCVPWTFDGSGVCGIECQTVPYDPACPQNWRCFSVTPVNGGDAVLQCLPVFDVDDCSMPPDGDVDMDADMDEGEDIPDGDIEDDVIDEADPEPDAVEPEPEPEPEPELEPERDSDDGEPEIDIPDSDPDVVDTDPDTADTDPDFVDTDPDDAVGPDADESADSGTNDTIGGGCVTASAGSFMLLLGILGLAVRRTRRR